MRSSADKHPLQVSDALLTIVAVTSGATLGECLFRLLYDAWLRSTSTPGYYLLYATPVLSVPLIAIPIIYTIQHRARGALIAIAAITVAVFVLTHFRGSHRLPGYYDLQSESRWPFYWQWLVSVGAAYVAYSLWRRAPSKRCLYMLIALSLAWTWLDALRGLNIITFIPYTRQFAVSALGVLVLIVEFAERREWLTVEDTT